MFHEHTDAVAAPFRWCKLCFHSAVSVAQLVEHRSVAPRVAGSNPVAHPSFFLRLVSGCAAASSFARADSAKRGRPISLVTAARAALYRARVEFLGFTIPCWHSARAETVSFSTPEQQTRLHRRASRIS